ncbi:valine--tRNA ligase [Cephaloticoccus primus]|uniref:Valine--tRNA ligase n=1 Tax=Cephaloticoccus primus TaxID=1548207 RepID=A0A139SII9_9BACT|nr:valine--tRNA ligase [Cephaloticoccus primus]KXU34398.1 valine--tRNA ligase [Cephaloticoccus primus]
MSDISKSYEAREIEQKWYAAWQAAGAFEGRAPEPVSAAPAGAAAPAREAYSIVIPPPNVTGVLTMGHVLNNTLQDVLIRRARLEGKAALWLPGTDHAGIATQTVVERQLRQQGQTRHDLGREAFVEKVWDWREEKGGIILEQLRRLGASCDWARTQFTMDAEYSRAVLTLFVELFNKGHIYRGRRMVNWCPVSKTALSDEEVIMKPSKGFMYVVRYELARSPGQFITVKTTRPETIPGDVAIAVHPDDPRYAALIGATVRRPLGPPAEIPIIADAAVDKDFGSGALKITPAHDKVDFEIGQRHGLAQIDVLEADGTLNALAGPELAGLDRFEGRKKAAELLAASGALVEAEPYENNVGYSERADVPVEPRLTWQWWLRYPRVEEAKAVVRDGLIKFYPARWAKVYLHWLDNLHDWCISRQLWWGHRIPVWYRKGLDVEALSEADLRDPQKLHVSLDGPPDPENWVQESDVLDTWASSWAWPFATLGWPDEASMQRAGFDAFYPTATLVTGPDIIFFWVARMIMAGLEFTRPGEPLERRIPFRNVYFTGIIRDAQGRKMSKSLGNSPDPLDLIAKYGADGLRFGILSIAPQGQDIRFQEERIEGGKNFCNKLWNACRFRQMSGPVGDNSSLAAILARLAPEHFDADDHAIFARLVETSAEVEKCFAHFEFSAAVSALYGFFWNDFCDWYVEVSKAKLQAPPKDGASSASQADDGQPASSPPVTRSAKSCLALQDLVLRQTLLLLHPFIPFITEELWQLLGYAGPESAANESASTTGQAGGRARREEAGRRPFIEETRIPLAAELRAAAEKQCGLAIDAQAVEQLARLKALVAQARTLKASRGLAARRDTRFLLKADDAQWAAVSEALAKLTRLMGASEIARQDSVEGGSAVVTPLGTLALDLAAALDVPAEKARLSKELDALAKHIAGTEARLANPTFAQKAPPAVVEGARRQLAEQIARREELTRLLDSLG